MMQRQKYYHITVWIWNGWQRESRKKPFHFRKSFFVFSLRTMRKQTLHSGLHMNMLIKLQYKLCLRAYSGMNTLVCKWQNDLFPHNFSLPLLSTRHSIILALCHSVVYRVLDKIYRDLHFRQKVYCHYFDAERKEIGEPFESNVFPESVIYCLRRAGTHYMSLTKNPMNSPEYPIPLLDRTMES